MKRSKIVISALLLLLIMVGCTSRNVQQPLTVTELLDLGERYLLELNFEQALVQFLRVIEVEPMNPRGYTGAAEAHLGLGQLDEAVAILQRGYDLTRDSSIFQLLDSLQEISTGAAEYSNYEELQVIETTASLLEIPDDLVPDDVREVFYQLSDAFFADNKPEVEAFMQSPIISDFMQQMFDEGNLYLRYLFGPYGSPNIKIANVVYFFVPANFVGTQKHYQVHFFDVDSHGNGRSIITTISINEYGQNFIWSAIEITNNELTGSFYNYSYVRGDWGWSTYSRTGQIVNGLFEGYVTSILEESSWEGLRRVDYYNNGINTASIDVRPPSPISESFREHILRSLNWPNI